jgi:enoyl-CoA hydratase/carnithine racemase
MSRNEGLSAIVIATDSPKYARTSKYQYSEGLPMPDCLLDRIDRDNFAAWEFDDDPFPPKPGKTWLVSSGYDPLELYQKGEHTVTASVDYLFDSLQDLARSMRGVKGAKIPSITVPHGMITDSGAVFLFASHVMATEESCFRINNPSRGLTLDPIGLSYLLPRLGREFKQPSKDYPGCALILGLMGYEADASDMMETGLATNFMETYHGIVDLEDALITMPPWNQQTLTKKPVRYYGEPEPSREHDAEFRNVAVADLVHALSAYRADGADIWFHGYDDHTLHDPSLDFVDAVPDFGERESNLVNYAVTFHNIFDNEKSVQGILERFKEIAARETKDPGEQEGIDVAKDFVLRLELQSPLALAVTYKLLYVGIGAKENLESCMARERRAQTNLMASADFEQWARHQTKKTGARVSKQPFNLWQHKSVAEVLPDEVDEILGKERKQ